MGEIKTINLNTALNISLKLSTNKILGRQTKKLTFTFLMVPGMLKRSNCYIYFGIIYLFPFASFFTMIIQLEFI